MNAMATCDQETKTQFCVTMEAMAENARGAKASNVRWAIS